MNKVRERILKEVAEVKYKDYEKHKDLISLEAILANKIVMVEFN